MNMQEVNELIQTFSRHGLTCLELEENGKRIVIKKEYGQPGHENVRQEGGAQVQPGGQLAEEEMWETADIRMPRPRPRERRLLRRKGTSSRLLW